MARNANDTEPMSERPEAGDADEVDSMLNALQVSPARGRKRAPEITPAPEAIAKAKSAQESGNAGTGKKRRESAKTLQMGGAPPLPAEVVNARVASDPAEQAFLNKTEEAARPRRRDEKTMMTGMKPPQAPASSYMVSAAIAFVAVLAVGLIGWRVMKYIESQAPERDATGDIRAVGKPANTGAPAVAVPLTARPVGALALPPPPASAKTIDEPVQAAPGTAIAPGTAGSAGGAGSAKAAGKPQPAPGTSAGGAAPSAASAPSGKYGGMVSPELQ